jgi:hypothetical protein
MIVDPLCYANLKSSRESNAQEPIRQTAYLEHRGEKRISKLIDVVEEIIREAHQKLCLKILMCRLRCTGGVLRGISGEWQDLQQYM